MHEGLIAKGGLDSTRFVDSVDDLGADADADASEPIVEIFSLPLTWGFDDSQGSEGGIIAHVSVDSGAAVLELRSQLPFGAAKRANAGAAIPVVQWYTHRHTPPQGLNGKGGFEVGLRMQRSNGAAS